MVPFFNLPHSSRTWYLESTSFVFSVSCLLSRYLCCWPVWGATCSETRRHTASRSVFGSHYCMILMAEIVTPCSSERSRYTAYFELPIQKKRERKHTTSLFAVCCLQDGDLATLDSRWSCTPSLGTGDSACSITYSFAGLQTVDSLNIGEFSASRLRAFRGETADNRRIRRQEGGKIHRSKYSGSASEKSAGHGQVEPAISCGC